MNLGQFIIIIVVAVLAVWYFRHHVSKNQRPSTLSQPPRKTGGNGAGSVTDPFLEGIATTKQKTDEQTTKATEAYKKQLEDQYSEDLKLKERLSQFARQHELDKSLVALWEEVEHYLAWAKRDDFQQWNKLGLENIEGSDEGKLNTVSFSYGTERYTLSKKEWHGMEADTYADFSLQESGLEVFGISCSVDFSEYGTSFHCLNITAFKKRGHWAQLLLEMYGRIQTEENKTSAKFRYFRADEIKTRFEE